MLKQLFSLILLVALSTNFAISQDSRGDDSKNHERMKAKKIAYITDALQLTPTEAEKFWPVYNEYKQKYEVLHNEKHAYDELGDVSESEAKDLLKKSILRDKKQVELKEEYNSKFLECIPAKKLVKLRGVERKFRKDVLSSIRDRYASKGS